MILSRAPTRITLGGGGTDLESYYSKHGGFLIAAGINKYCTILANKYLTRIFTGNAIRSQQVKLRVTVLVPGDTQDKTKGYKSSQYGDYHETRKNPVLYATVTFGHSQSGLMPGSFPFTCTIEIPAENNRYSSILALATTRVIGPII